MQLHYEPNRDARSFKYKYEYLGTAVLDLITRKQRLGHIFIHRANCLSQITYLHT